MVVEELQLLKVPEVAQVLKVSDRRAWELVHSGELPSILIGASRRVTRTALAEFIAARIQT